MLIKSHSFDLGGKRERTTERGENSYDGVCNINSICKKHENQRHTFSILHLSHLVTNLKITCILGLSMFNGNIIYICKY